MTKEFNFKCLTEHKYEIWRDSESHGKAFSEKPHKLKKKKKLTLF